MRNKMETAEPEMTGPEGGLLGRSLDQPVVLLLMVGTLLAVVTVFAKAAPQIGWHPLGLLQWSVLGGALILYTVSRMRPFAGRADTQVSGVYRSHAFWLYLAVSGVLFILPNMIAAVAAPIVGAGFVSLSFAFPLVLTYAFAVGLGIERFQMMRAAGVLSGLAGGVLLAVSGADLSGEAGLWSLVALSIPVFLAIGNIYRTVKWPEGARPVDLAIGMMLVGAAALFVFNVVRGVPMVPEAWTPDALLLVAAQIAVFSFQYALYFRLQQTAGPVYLSQIGSVAAVTGLGLGYAVFGETPDLPKLAAVVAVGAGIVLVTLGKRYS
ncbi:DMT family transporter [Roseibium denhamense]|uniref:EamA-like transporter family protein n=1 Tax=Roseibium denhamense TaxID=76305 RepID=A0ABY1NSL8_9HYPH|nr:DMT family transporter [Roseibium denhamense]MTI05328.1 DMT family transporter [Roseibium denhamense]SMP17110.1 EamA-like transporter family protein [Roseibium denhamense]